MCRLYTCLHVFMYACVCMYMCLYCMYKCMLLYACMMVCLVHIHRYINVINYEKKKTKSNNETTNTHTRCISTSCIMEIMYHMLIIWIMELKENELTRCINTCSLSTRHFIHNLKRVPNGPTWHHCLITVIVVLRLWLL